MFKIIGADGKEYGPIGLEQIRQWIQEGRLNAQTRVLPEGAPVWKLLGDVPELAALLPPPALAAAPAPLILPPPAAPPGTNPLAVTGMILGIVSIVFSCCCFGLPWNLAALICSIIALSQIKNNPNQEGRGMAIAGIVLALAGVILAIALAILVGSTEFLHRLEKLGEQ